ncbi:MAG: GGDEF domain-containing protein [Pseudomonadota bacterium]
MLLTFLLTLSAAASAADVQSVPSSFEARLQAADEARSSQPEKFLELLDQLRSDKRGATKRQLQRLQYLEAYAVGVYQDRLKDGAQQAKALFAKSNDLEVRYRAGALVANYSAVSRDFKEGLHYLEESLAMRAKIRNAAVRHDGASVAAMLYNEVGQYRIAMRYADEVLREKPTPRARCVAATFKLQSQYELNELPKEDAAIAAVVDDCAALNERIFANIARSVLARKMVLEKRHLEAAKLLEDALPEVQATRYPRLIAGIQSVLAEIKLDLGDARAAESHAQATVALGEQIKSSATLVSAYNTLYQIAADREKPSVAMGLYKRYAEAQMAHQDDVKARELAYEIVKHETQLQSQRLAEAERKNQVLQLQQKLERESAQKARLAMVFLMLVLAGIIFWAILIKRHQSQLQRLAQTDTLTGLGNRHFFTQKSERALVDAARAGDSAALVMFDLDHFKAINDTYGHGAGDWVLKQVGRTCAAHCRKVDYLGRIGGEEFAVLLPGMDLVSAARLAEDCRAQLAQIDTRESGYSFVVTASFGVSSTAQSGYDLSRLLSHADQMLYRAKNEGRNRVCLYTAEAAADQKSPKRSPNLTIVNG